MDGFLEAMYFFPFISTWVRALELNPSSDEVQCAIDTRGYINSLFCFVFSSSQRMKAISRKMSQACATSSHGGRL